MVSISVLLLFCTTSSVVQAAAGGRFRRAQRCLPEKIHPFYVHPTETGFSIQLPVLNVPYRCNGKAEYVIRWTPRGEETHEERIEWVEQFFSVAGLKPWTTVDIKAHMEYKGDPEGDDEETPLIEKETTTRKGIPSPPVNFRVDEIEEESIRLTWDAPKTPNGPIDGYAYRVCRGDHHCDSRGEKKCKMELDTYNKTVQYLRGPRPFRYYGVSLRAYNVVEKRKRLYSGTTKLCLRSPPKPVKPLEHVKVECEKEPNRVSVSWDLPKENGSKVSDVYIVEITGRKDGKTNEDVTVMANKSAACDDSVCHTTAHDLKAEFEYSVSVRPYIEHIGPFGEGYTVEKCILPPSAPPPATKEAFRIENDALNKSEAEFAFWKDMYNDTNGEISYYDVLVAEDKEIEKCDMATVWKDAHSKSPVPCYLATPAFWMPFTSGPHADASMACASNVTYAQCVLGTDTKCGEDRCNGPLKEGIKYAIRIRAYTAGGYTDSSPLYVTQKTTEEKNGGKRMNSEVFTVLIMGVLPLAFAKVLLQERCRTVQWY